MKLSALVINNVLSIYYISCTKYQIAYLNLHNHCIEVDTLIMQHALQLSKLRLRELKYLAQCHLNTHH